MLKIKAEEKKKKTKNKKKDSNPTTGLRYSKFSESSLTVNELHYQVKGDKRIINFIEHEFFNMIGILDDDIIYENFKSNNENEDSVETTTLIYKNGMTDFDLQTKYFPEIEILTVNDNMIDIKFEYNITSNETFIVDVLLVVESILEICVLSKKLIINRINLISKMLITEDSIRSLGNYPAIMDIIIDSNFFHDETEETDDKKDLLLEEDIDPNLETT